MSSVFCAYCFNLILENEKCVILEYDEKRRVSFHDSCYHEFCRKCTLIRKACIALRSGQYSELIERDKCTTYSPLSIPDQAEDNCVCPICMDRRADSLLFPCRHRMCSDCILDWRRKSLSKRIPGTTCCICRRLIERV
ncbi:hypothetical protein WA171_002591, partial [Blastocystis sp. BT1]